MPRISVVVNMFRPGGFDVLTELLRAQTFQDFELLVADELHRWRAVRIEQRLWRLPFPVKHLQPRDSLFPVASTMRAANTCLAAASGELVVALPDNAFAAPDFLQDHWDLYQRTGGKALGITPYLMRQVKPEWWAYPPSNVWEAVGYMVQGSRADWDWSLLKADHPDLEEMCLPADLAAESPGFQMRSGTHVNEWYAHYRCDSAPLAALKAVNGWDELYDGGYIYGDIDMSLRLMASGLIPTTTRVPVHILDCHYPVKRAPQSAYRSWAMREVLEATRARCAEGHPACDFGLVPTEKVKKAFAALTSAFSWISGDVGLVGRGEALLSSVLVREWAQDGPVRVVVPADETFQWRYLVPDVLVATFDGNDVGGFASVLKDRARVIRLDEVAGRCGPLAKTVVLSLRGYEGQMTNLLDDAKANAEGRLIVTGSREQIAAVEAWVGVRDLPEVIYHDADAVLPADGALILLQGRFRRAVDAA